MSDLSEAVDALRSATQGGCTVDIRVRAVQALALAEIAGKMYGLIEALDQVGDGLHISGGVETLADAVHFSESS